MRLAIYTILLILGGFGMKFLVDYPAILTAVAILWCVLGARLVYEIINGIINKKL